VSQRRYHFAVVSYRDIRHPEFGGAEVIMYEICRRFAAWGHRVSFLTGHWSDAPRRETIEGMDIHRAGNTYTFNYVAPWMLRRLMRTETFDLVIEDINKIPFYTPWFQKQAPVLAVVPHLFGTTVFQQASLPLAAYVYGWEQLIPLAYRRSRFSVLSHTTAADLERRGIARDRMQLIRAGIDHTYYQPPAREGRVPRPIVTYLGRIKKYKRIDLVIRALPAVLAEVPQAEYWIVGDGDYRPQLEALAEKLGLGDHVRFLGFQSGREKLETLYRTRALAYTSPKEGWGLSVIEANALGIPAIASDAPGLRESVRDGETGFLVPHGDVAALARALIRLFREDDLWWRLGRAGMEWAAEFHWDRAAKETYALAEQLIMEWKDQG